ncbi:uncharacterized protein IL334_006788 [Kwoniella shivajii]|uniref:Zn(2)-C6 fungal-type domain-containing protein n=1 Tax=Kwoniella shivajii TaxID=564305 RepID=A0ABZ1D864_9TREE|nr:hypothetical protein IL334_006788 [Kwoniella shivajii]
MPKEDPSHPPPLKRGDACLYCRKRRIRCSAEKPTCQHCSKSGRECVYDSGKPVSRVKQLEEKLAQLENLLQGGGPGIASGSSNGGGVGGSRRESQENGSTSSRPPALNHTSSSGSESIQNDFDIGMDSRNDPGPGDQAESSTSFGYISAESFDINMFDLILASQPSGSGSSNGFASFGGSFFNNGNMGAGAETGATPNFGFLNNNNNNNDNNNNNNSNSNSFSDNVDNNGNMSSNQGPSIESLFDFNLLDPNYMSMLNEFQSTSTGPSPSTIPQQRQQPTQLSQPPPPPPPFQQQQQQQQPSQISSMHQQPSQISSMHQQLLSASQNENLPFQIPATSRPPKVLSPPSAPHFPPSIINPGPYPESYFLTNEGPLTSPPVSTSNILYSEMDQKFIQYNQSTFVQPPADAQEYLNNIHGSMGWDQSLQNKVRSQGLTQQSLASASASKSQSPNTGALSLEVDKTMKRSSGPYIRTSLLPAHEQSEEINSDIQQSTPGITDPSTSYQSAGTGAGTNASTNTEEKAGQGSTLVGGWFDAHDLPKVARDHLLDLFFSGMRLFGQEFHVPKFMASLTLPAHKRPHPCLLYSMYTLASRISDSNPIRNLEPHFYKIASSQLETSIGMADRLLDATRASTLLAIYKFSKARYHEGWMMTGQAARLAVSCGLHQIPSSVFKPPTQTGLNADLVGMMRHRSYVLPPAVDAIEHGERIWAFWSIYATDRCGSISTQWPPAIADEVITTPFPRPLHEYELGLVTEQDDHQSVQSIYKPAMQHNPLPHYAESTLISIRLRAISILERASKLMYQPPEEGWERSLAASTPSDHSSPSSNIDDYLYTQIGVAAGFVNVQNKNGTSTSTPASASSNRSKEGWTRTARIRNARAYEEVKQALLKIESDLPPEWRTEWWKWDGKVQEWHFGKPRKDVITLHFVLGCAWMFLYDVFSFSAENTDAVNVAQRLTVTVKFVSRQVMSSDLDVFIAMTWSFVSKILIREMKRLQSLGDIDGANALEPDIQTLVTALREFGQRYTIGAMQAMRTERYRKSTKEEMDLLYKADEDELENIFLQDMTSEDQE